MRGRPLTPEQRERGRATRSRLAAERTARILELAEQGLGSGEIARRLGCCPDTVCRVRRAHGQAGSHGGARPRTDLLRRKAQPSCHP